MKRALDYLTYVAVRLLVAAIQALPMTTCAYLASLLARLCCRLQIRHDVIDDNLSHAFPDWSAAKRQQVEHQNWQHILLMIFEMVHADRAIRETNWRRHVRLHGMEPVVRQLLGTRPCVLVAAHFGNFEVSARLLGIYGFATFAVARPLDNPYLNRWLNRLRSRFGQIILPKKGSAHDAEARLAAGGALAVLGDQAAGPKGQFVEFFGRPASTHKAIALMALAHEAPLVVSYTRRLGAPMQFEVGCSGITDPRSGAAETAGVRELTAWYTQRLERSIRNDPEQYWWVHRRWKDQRALRAAARKAA